MEPVNALQILVVEDDHDFAALLRLLLGNKLAAEVTIAEDCASARNILSSSSFDLITLDYQLPGGNGLQLLEEITSQKDHPPVVMVTGKGDEGTAVNAFGAGAAGYVMKDTRLSVMLPAVIEKALAVKYATESLQGSELRYRRLFEASKDGILILDAETGRITDVNPFLFDLLGYTRDEVLGKCLWEIGTFKDMPLSRELFSELQLKEYIRYERLPLETKEGERIDVEFVSNVYSADRKKVIQCNIRDITVRKTVEEALEKITSIVDSSDDAIFSEGLDGTIESWNDGAERLYGYSADEAIGQNFSILMSPERADAVNKILEGIARGERFDHYDTVRRTKDGRLVDVSMAISPVKDAGGNIIGASSVARDITARKEAEEELQRANDELEVFAGTASHDLKGPHAAMRMANETLRELLNGPLTEEDRAVADQVIDLMHSSLLRADRLVDDLLRLAGAGQLPRKVERIDVHRVVETVLEERAPDIQERGIRVEVGDDLGEVVADYTHIYQLFANLIGNAIQHSDSQMPVIEVSHLGDDDRGSHRYLVRDNGSGIPADSLEKIFTPFFKGKAGGTGIGLAIVEKTIKVYGGSIKAYNDNGACFEFILRDFRGHS